jgi:FAD/FMN-containing dehydrogenase
MISRQVARVVPHDGYILVGMDPVTGVGCFLTMENSYGARMLSRMSIDFALGRSSPLRVLVRGVPDRRYRTQLQNMAAEGFDSEIRIELTRGGRAWGVLVLLRERGRTSFSPADTTNAECLAQPLALALKRFVASTPLSSVRSDLPPGLIIIGHHDEIKVATPTGREALRAFTPDRVLTDAELFTSIWNITYRTRRTGGPTVCRVLAPQGWIALHAQLLEGTPLGEVAITTQPASAEVLLPVVAAWHDITRREQTVIEQALEGLPAPSRSPATSGDGNFHLLVMIDPHDQAEVDNARKVVHRLSERAIDMQGACTGERGIGQGKAAPMPLQHGAALDVMRTINIHKPIQDRHIQGRSTCKSS